MRNCMERRKNKRVSVDGKAIAVFKPYPILMGEVVDISMGGMGILYHRQGNGSETHTHLELELICLDGTRLSRIPFQLVSDISINPASSQDAGALRRAGLKFGALTADQKTRLEDFISGCEDSALELQAASIH